MKKDKKLSSLSRDVLAMIKAKKIKPQPKWKFIWRNYFVWAISILSLLVGSLAFSVIIYMLKNSDWDIYENINNSLFKFILVTLPYFWIIFLVIFVFVADYNLKHTKRGYKYQVHFLILFSVALSMLLGSFMYNMGVGRAIDDSFAEKIPLYGKVINRMHKRGMIWYRPSDGFLAGIVVEIGDDNSFKINDIHNMVWQVDASTADMLLLGDLAVEKGVRIVGEDTSTFDDLEGHFRAIKVLPLPNKSWLQEDDRLKHDLREQLLPPKARDRFDARLNQTNRDFDAEEMQEIGKSCSKKEDCKTPLPFLIRSNCAYESKCIDNQCKVVCPVPHKNTAKAFEGKAQCQENSDCDCSPFLRRKSTKCVCYNEKCLVIVAE